MNLPPDIISLLLNISASLHAVLVMKFAKYIIYYFTKYSIFVVMARSFKDEDISMRTPDQLILIII